MVKDTLNSIFDNLKERTTNPFLGTLIIVWVFRNWTLVYGLFNFDKEFKLKDKLKYISDYYDHQSFIWNMLFVVLITLAVLLFTYCMLAISRFLTDTYNKRVIPFIAIKTDKSSIVLKTEYLKLQDIIKLLESRLEEERLAKVGAQNERDILDKRVFDLSNTSSKQIDNEDVNTNSKYVRLTKWFKEKGMTGQVDSTLLGIQKSQSFQEGDNVIDKMLLEDIVEYYNTDERLEDYYYYRLTKDGKEFLDYWNNQV